VDRHSAWQFTSARRAVTDQSEAQLLHMVKPKDLFLVLPEAGKVIWGYQQFCLRDDRVVVNNGG